MNDTIISRDHIRAKARAAFEAGKARDDHGFNWHAPAIVVWQDEWDRAYADWAHPAQAAA